MKNTIREHFYDRAKEEKYLKAKKIVEDYEKRETRHEMPCIKCGNVCETIIAQINTPLSMCAWKDATVSTMYPGYGSRLDTLDIGEGYDVLICDDCLESYL